MWILWIILGIIGYILSFILCYRLSLKIEYEKVKKYYLIYPNGINNGQRLLKFCISLIPFINLLCIFTEFFVYKTDKIIDKKDEEKERNLKFLKFLEPKE